MNSTELYSDLFEIYSTDIQKNTKLIIALSIFISINLIVTVVNIISQHYLKTREKKIFSFSIKEKKRIEYFEKVYQDLDKLTFNDGRINNDDFLKEIQELQKYLTKSRLYFKKDEFKLINEFCDYFMEVLADYRKKDYQKEFDFFDKLEKKFNK